MFYWNIFIYLVVNTKLYTKLYSEVYTEVNNKVKVYSEVKKKFNLNRMCNLAWA